MPFVNHPRIAQETSAIRYRARHAPDTAIRPIAAKARPAQTGVQAASPHVITAADPQGGTGK
jgi:hypothetical protein